MFATTKQTWDKILKSITNWSMAELVKRISTWDPHLARNHVTLKIPSTVLPAVIESQDIEIQDYFQDKKSRTMAIVGFGTMAIVAWETSVNICMKNPQNVIIKIDVKIINVFIITACLF